MRFSGPSAAAQWAARLWLLAAAGSALLPPETRRGWWLPLHLALAGAAGTAIAGAMPRFAASLAGSRARLDSWAAPALVSGGAAAVAVGHVTAVAWLLAVGGTAYGLAGVLLAWIVVRAWRTGSNPRHRAILTLYLVAALAVAAGAVLGALLGAGAVGAAYGGFRRAHIALNLWGFLGLTIAGSLLVLVPVVLRLRSPDRRPYGIAAAFVVGLTLMAGGLAADVQAIAAVGAAVYALGAAGLAGRTLATVRRGPRMPETTPGLHLGAAVAWLTAASVVGAVALAVGRIDSLQIALVVAVALGVAVQALLGSWTYLVPVSSPGGADVRRRVLGRAAAGGLPQVAVFNAGALLTVGFAARVLPSAVGGAGLALVVAAGLFSLAKLPWLGLGGSGAGSRPDGPGGRGRKTLGNGSPAS